MAWRLHGSNEPGDTGHVFVVAEMPTPLTSEHDGNVHFAVRVYDSSSKEHFNDSRSDGASFKGGVGSGTLHIETDANSIPFRFRFGEATQYQTAPTAIGYHAHERKGQNRSDLSSIWADYHDDRSMKLWS